MSVVRFNDDVWGVIKSFLFTRVEDEFDIFVFDILNKFEVLEGDNVIEIDHKRKQNYSNFLRYALKVDTSLRLIPYVLNEKDFLHSIVYRIGNFYNLNAFGDYCSDITDILYKLEFLVEIGWKITITKDLVLNKNMLEDCSIDNTDFIMEGCEGEFIEDFSDIYSIITNIYDCWYGERCELLWDDYNDGWKWWEHEYKLRQRWGFNQYVCG
jgi:hypothetical protein